MRDRPRTRTSGGLPCILTDEPARVSPQQELEPRARDACRQHPWFDAAAEFCERYDENCFDPGYDWLLLEHFAPAVQEVFSREPALR
jgi:hypothetical protein